MNPLKPYNVPIRTGLNDDHDNSNQINLKRKIIVSYIERSQFDLCWIEKQSIYGAVKLSREVTREKMQQGIDLCKANVADYLKDSKVNCC
jgi:hypothetical protein